MESEELKLSSFGEVIDCYLRFAFIRSCKFTNSNQSIKKIVFTGFLDIFYMMQSLQEDISPPIAMDIMIDAAGANLTKRDYRPDSELFIKDKLHLHIIEAINELDNTEGLLLVLFHIDKIDIERLTEIFTQPAESIKILIGRAQRLFIENLSELMPPNSPLFADDIDKLLDLLNVYFNCADMDRMRNAILTRLASRRRSDN